MDPRPANLLPPPLGVQIATCAYTIRDGEDGGVPPSLPLKICQGSGNYSLPA